MTGMGSSEVKRRRVMHRDHDEIASYISGELKRRQGQDWRMKHEERWREVDRQIAMDSPDVSNQGDGDEDDWHNAIQLGDLTDASETITADILRLVFPTDRKFFVPHVEIPPLVDPESGEQMMMDPKQQRAANGVVRNLMVQQHKDFGVRSRAKLALKEILHHGSVVATVEMETLYRYERGSKPNHLRAPVPVIHSMWNCFPDNSPTIQGTELFYKGSMIIRSWKKLPAALEMENWINKDKLDAVYNEDDDVEIITYYGDLFLKRYDGNVLFPNRKTIVTENGIFLFTEVNPLPYPEVIYTGYERDDVRDPYYTSPIVKRAPMGKFATHMANKTMDAVDLKTTPPIAYDSLDNSMKGDGPQIYPGAKIGAKGGINNLKVLDVGDAATGLAAMQWAKQALQEGTTVDAVRKGVAPGTEQTATEVLKTEQRAEVREVEFATGFENEFLGPYLTMQCFYNGIELKDYPFYNDEPNTPDFLRMSKKDWPNSILVEVTGSKTILGEQERSQRFGQTIMLAAQNELLAQETNWNEVAKQMWDDSKQKDPERFVKGGQDEVQRALEQQAQQFQQQMAQMQQQMQQMMEAAQKAEEARRAETVKVQEAKLKSEQDQITLKKLELQRVTLQEQLKLAKDFERAEDSLQKRQQDVRERELKMECALKESQASSEAQAAEKEKAEGERKEPLAQTINVVTGSETKTIQIVRDKDGRPTGAVVQDGSNKNSAGNKQ